MGMESPNVNTGDLSEDNPELPKRPEGELQGRSVEGEGGQWYSKYGEKIELPTQQEFTEKEPNVQEKKKSPIPGGEIPRYSMWESTEGTGKALGVKDPDGNFIPMEKEQSFAVVRDKANNRYQCRIWPIIA